MRGGFERPQFVERTAQRIDHPAEQPITDRHAQHVARAVHDLPGFDMRAFIEQHATDAVLVQDAGEAEAAIGEAHHLAGPQIGEARNTHDAIGDILDTTEGLRDRPDPRGGDTVRRVACPIVQGVRRRHRHRPLPL